MRIYSLKSWPFRFIFNSPSHFIIIEIVMYIYNSASSTPNVDRKQNVDCALYKINYCIVYSDCDQICWVGEDRWGGGGGGGCKKSGSRISLGWYLIL